MNNKIEPTYVTSEQGKLLKEKGFIEKSKYHFPNLSDKQEVCSVIDWNNFTDMAGNSDYYTAPEQWVVVEWLFDEHDIDVSVNGKLHYNIYPDSEYGEGELQWHFEYKIIQNKDGQKCEVIEPKTWFDTKQEAYSSAINYILNNLI